MSNWRSIDFTLKIDSRVILLLSWYIVDVTLFIYSVMFCLYIDMLSLYSGIYMYDRCGSQAENANSSRAHGLTSWAQGAMNANYGTLEFVTQ